MPVHQPDNIVSTHSPGQPKYRFLAEEFRRKIEQGEWLPGQALPSYLEVKQLYNVSTSTVEKTYQVLEAERLIERRSGSGVYVREKETRAVTGLIGFVDASPNFTQRFQYYSQFVEGLRSQAYEQGQCMVLIDDPAQFTRWQELAGLVLSEQEFSHHAADHNWDDIRQFIPDSLPIVNTLFQLPGISSITIDEADGIRQLVGHLAGQGHRRIGYMGRMHQSQFANQPQVQSRYRAYLEALREHNLEEDPALAYSPPLEHGRNHPAYGYDGMQLWLHNGWRELGCTAVLGHNDETATGMIDALREAQYDVPGDVSVAGFDGTETLLLSLYGLTTIRCPMRRMGIEAIKALAAHSIQSLTLPVELQTGKTTAPAKSIAMASV